jgi:hypothetical protein
VDHVFGMTFGDMLLVEVSVLKWLQIYYMVDTHYGFFFTYDNKDDEFHENPL